MEGASEMRALKVAASKSLAKAPFKCSALRFCNTYIEEEMNTQPKPLMGEPEGNGQGGEETSKTYLGSKGKVEAEVELGQSKELARVKEVGGTDDHGREAFLDHATHTFICGQGVEKEIRTEDDLGKQVGQRGGRGD